MDHPTFLAQLQAHQKILYKVAYLYGRTEADRQDLVQEIIVQLWRSVASFDGRSALSTWIYRVALNVAISERREASRRPVAAVALEDAHEAILVAPPDEGAAGVMAQLVARLGELDRALVLLHLEGHAHEDIAAILGLSVSNVGTRLSRLKQRLRSEHSERTRP
jgi:RNA polymerase sigma-70 factor (ECF subfamily)